MTERQRGAARRGGPRNYGGTFSEARHTWVNLPTDNIVVFVQPDEPPEEGATTEPGDAVTLFLSHRSGRGFTMDLSRFTELELLAIKEVITEAFDMALPICKERDAHAQRAWEEDEDDSHIRLYRPVPEVHRRKRRKPEHGESVRE